MSEDVLLTLKTVRELVAELPTYEHDKWKERCRVTRGCQCFCGCHVPYPQQIAEHELTEPDCIVQARL